MSPTDADPARGGLDRRAFLGLVGTGSAILGAGIALPRVVAATERGYLVESESEYGAFQVEQLTGGRRPYDIDPDVLEPMSEKFTIFSRNGWDPVRLESLRRQLDVTRANLVEERGLRPDQTRLDYALMAAAWRHAGGDSYGWEGVSGQVRGAGLDRMGPWDPAELDMDWADATRAVKHAALFYGASLAGVAELDRR